MEKQRPASLDVPSRTQPVLERVLLTGNNFIWIIPVVGLLSFVLLYKVLTDSDNRIFLGAAAAAAVSFLFTALSFEYVRRVRSRERDSSAQLLNRMTSGDLDFGRGEIDQATSSQEMSAAMRALVLGLERTITRFAQLSSDVRRVSEQISSSARTLARNASNQLGSTETTAGSVKQIDQSINFVQKSMENLSLSAEETSTSILEMSASIDEVSRIAETLSDFVESTAADIEEMISSINEVATNTESFSSFAIETASSIVQMNATTREIGRSARQSSDFARYVTEAANQGQGAVNGTVDGMRKIQEAVEEAKQALRTLGERSMEIGEIVRVIDEIAGQTNLLALNAAIIAAQAGDKGKGFAVVADEIRDLSERTSVSTEEIRTLITNVQRSVERAVEQMNISSDRVHEGVDLTARAEQTLAKILDLTAQSTQSIDEIARATEEQIRGSEAATQAIEEITKMVQQTANATQQQSQTSMKIGEQTSSVRDYTKHLKRAMHEQESGSRSISRAMDTIMASVSRVLESTSVLTNESAQIVQAMGVVEDGTRENNFTVSDLNQMAISLDQGASLLTSETSKFQLPEPARGGSLVTASVLPAQLTLDPLYCQFIALIFIQFNIFETLVRFGEGAELVPGLAEKWEVLEHGLVYRFHLKRNVKFHNGRTMTAHDVENSVLRLMSPTNDSPGKWLVNDILGAKDVFSGKSNKAEGLRVVDENTIEFKLTEPLAFFMLLLTLPEMSVIPVETAKDPEHFRLHPVGTGPFVVREAIDDKHVILDRNVNYHVPGIPRLDELRFRLDFKSFKEFADELVRGNVDIAHRVPLNIAADLKSDPAYAPYLLDTVNQHTSYIGYDTRNPPFDKVEVRQALNYAIDRQRINEKIFSGLGVTAQSLLPPGLLGYDAKLKGYEYDPERARALLQKGGYPSGFSIDYWTWDTDEFYLSGQIPLIIEDLAKVGIRVQVSHHSVQETRANWASKNHGSIFASNWFADFPDPDNFFFVFFHSMSSTIPGINYHSDELDRRIEGARRTNDNDKRAEIYRDLNRLVIDQAPLACLFHERFFVLHKPHVRSLRPHLVPPPVRYHELWLEK